MADDSAIEGASVRERLVEACRRDNVDLLQEIIAGCADDDEISALLNNTTSVMGNHLYHEAALRGNYDVIDILLDQPNFECDPVNRVEGDTPLHSAIRWINGEPPAQRDFGCALVEMMLEAGSSTRARNKARLTPYQLVDPRNAELRDVIQKHEYAALNAGDFVTQSSSSSGGGGGGGGNSSSSSNNKPPALPSMAAPAVPSAAAAAADDDDDDDIDDDAEFSGSDEEERAEFERRKASKRR